MSDQDWVAQFNDALQSWDKRFIIASDDVDGLLSASLMEHVFGARLIGVYGTTNLLLFDGFTTESAIDALWVDHDISHPGIICMGQHIVRIRVNDQLPTRHRPNFNPNLVWPRAWENCFKGRGEGKGEDKYPFATIHFLMRGLSIEDPTKYTEAYSLLAHADGSWVTPLDYPDNCKIWLSRMFEGQDGLVKDLVNRTYTDSDSLQAHSKVLSKLKEAGINPGRSRNNPSNAIPQGWSGIEGHQKVGFARNHNRERWMIKFRNVLSYISSTMGWKVDLPQQVTQVISGNASPEFPDRIQNLDEWMVENEVFSHAIINRNRIRYTTDLDLT